MNNIVNDSFIRVLRKALVDELTSHKIYLKLSTKVKDNKLSQKLKEMAMMEDKHSRIWRQILSARGVDASYIKESKIKVFFIYLLYKLIGLSLVIKLLEAGENDAIKTYGYLLEEAKLSVDEKNKVKEILYDELIHEYDLYEEEGKIKGILYYLRDAILGLHDGVVEILSVSTGLAGAYNAPLPVAIGGLIVGIAGALSMSIGMFGSVNTQRQVRLNIISRILITSKYVSNILKERLSLLIIKKGFSEGTAKRIVDDVMDNHELLGKVVAEEEYGLREEFIENPKLSAIYTGVSYLIGAFIPLIPYFIVLPTLYAIPLSFLLAVILLAITGSIIAVISEVNIKNQIIQLISLAILAAITSYAVGHLASIILGIQIS